MRNITCTDLLRRGPLAAVFALMATHAWAQAMPTGCFARSYTGAHLAANPDQTVAEIVVELSDTSPGGGYIGTAIVRARMAATRSTQQAGTANRWYDNYVLCERPGGTGWPNWVDPARMTCFAECDGGYFQILRAGKDEMLIRTEYLTLSGEACGGGAALGDDGAATTTYKLFAASPEVCAP